MINGAKTLRARSGHRIACLRLAEATIELILTFDGERLDMSRTMQDLVRHNLGLDINMERADKLCIKFFEGAKGRLNEETLFKFALNALLETVED